MAIKYYEEKNRELLASVNNLMKKSLSGLNKVCLNYFQEPVFF